MKEIADRAFDMLRDFATRNNLGHPTEALELEQHGQFLVGAEWQPEGKRTAVSLAKGTRREDFEEIVKRVKAWVCDEHP